MNFKKGISNVVQGTADIIQNIILRQIDNRYMIFDNAISLYSHNNKDAVFLKPNGKSPLYCIELTGLDNVPRNPSSFATIGKSLGYELDSKATLFYSKSPVTLNNNSSDYCTKQSIYLFTPSRKTAKILAKRYKSPLKQPDEIILALLDIGLANRYYNDRKTFNLNSFLLNRHNSDIWTDEMAMVFKTIFAEGVYKAVGNDLPHGVKKYHILQGVGFDDFSVPDKPDMPSAMMEDWTGYIAINIDFSKHNIKMATKEWRNSSKNYDTDKEVKDSYREMHEEIVPKYADSLNIINIIAVIDNLDIMEDLSEHLHVNLYQKTVFAKDIVYRTPILERDLSLDFMALSKDTERYFPTFHKRQNVKTKKSNDMYGRDVYGNYTTYSFSESDSPHWAIIAPTRSGKTFFVLSMVAQSLNTTFKVNPEYLEMVEEDKSVVEDLGILDEKIVIDKIEGLGERKYVHFDTGYSAKKWAVALQRKCPKQVDIYEDNVNTLRFGLVNVRWDVLKQTVNKEDMLFVTSIINLILELTTSNGNDEGSLGAGTLSPYERNELSDAYDLVFQNKEYVGMTMRELKNDRGYDRIVEIFENRYRERSEDKKEDGKFYHLFLDKKTTDFGELEGDISFMTKPRLSDVVKLLRLKADGTSGSVEERGYASSTASKLNVIANDNIYANYDSANIKQSDYFYMELEVIKNLGKDTFIPIFMLIFQKLYRRDVINAQINKQQDKAPAKVYYIIEEAHNFFKVKSLVSIFTVVLRESARYNIHLGFITQNASDYNSDHLLNIGTRIVLPSDKPDEQKGELLSYWMGDGDNDTEAGKAVNIKFFEEFAKDKKYYAFMKYGKGVLTLKPLVSKEEEWLFDSNPPKEKK